VLYFRGYIPDIPRFQKAGIDATISINDHPTEVVNLKAGKFTLTRLIKEAADITSISLHFSDAQIYDNDKDKREVSAFVNEISINDIPDFATFKSIANEAGEKFVVTGIDDDGWIAKSAEFKAPSFDAFKVLKIDLEMPGWAPIVSNLLKASVDGRTIKSEDVPRQTFASIYVPLPPGPQRLVHLDAEKVFALPGDGRMRSFAIKNIAFENLTKTDLIARGWHSSGYLFDIEGADTDGWVEGRLLLRFPPSERFREAVVEVVRYPSRRDYPLSVSIGGGAERQRMLGLEAVERILIPLSRSADTTATLSADQRFPLGAPDTRTRSYRVVNIDFE
jgi:hypothetical protein